jgi:hypothetical protein
MVLDTAEINIDSKATLFCLFYVEKGKSMPLKMSKRFMFVSLVVVLSSLTTHVSAEPVVGTPGPAGTCNSIYPTLPREMRVNLLPLLNRAKQSEIATDARYGFVIEADRIDDNSVRLSIWGDSNRNNLLCCEEVKVR